MKKVRIGIVGLGRLGKNHACNLAGAIPSAKLVAACSIVREELTWAENTLGIAQTYSDYQQMLATDIDAVFLVSSTAVHPEQIIAALEAGKHVFCEKPLAFDYQDCLKVEQVANKNKNLLCMIGFVRRYDPSYYRAWQKVRAGDIGMPFMVYAQSGDVITTAKFQIPFAKASGGLFLDMNIHDIDLVHWFCQSQIVEVTATGGAYVFPQFAEYQDADNAAVLCRLANSSYAIIYGTRTSAHGHSTCTEIKGTKGDLLIGKTPAIDRITIADSYGVRQECVSTFFDRFKQAFLLEAKDFIDCIIESKQARISLREAAQATKVAVAMRESFQTQKTIKIDNEYVGKL